MKVRKLGDKKPRIILFQGSSRDKDTCPNMESKSHLITDYIVEKWSPFVEFQVIDLSINQQKKPIIQPCKGCISTAGGYHCHFPCIAPDQRVHMLNGFKEIKDIRVGDILQDGNRVINHMITSMNEKIYELKLTDGRCLKLTSNHKVKVFSKERYRDKNSKFRYYRKKEWLELKDIKVGDNIPYIDTDISMMIDDESFSDDLYKIYGMLWGDGTLCNNSAILYVDKREVDFIENIKAKFGDHIISILEHKLINPKIKIEQVNNTEMLKINFGTKIGKKFKDLFIKDSAEDRRLNINAFNNKNQIFNFLNGWISTDGSINKSNTIDLYNTSYNLLRDLQLLLSRIGITSNITDLRHLKTSIRGKSYQRCSFLTISNQKSMRIILDNIELINNKKKNKLLKYSIGRKNLHTFSKVKSIKEVGYSEVYDIEVENSHEFNCEGIKVHNCSCYFKGNKKEKDLLSELGVYELMQGCDAFVVVSPIHWFALSSQVKTLFDRLVCTNQTLAIDDAKKLLGDDIKNSIETGKLAKSGKHSNLLRNHLEGKVAAFYVHGDDGANDYEGKELPESYQDVLADPFAIDPKAAVLPYVMQLKYSGIFVPDHLVQAFHINKGVDYYTANKTFNKQKEFKDRADMLIENLLDYLDEKP